MKAVLQTKISPAYDDVPEQFYHFPRTYLNQITASVGDWIVYYEPRRSSGDNLSRGGRLAYFAVAQIVGLRPDRNKQDHFYADISNYLDFDTPVPFREGDFYYEAAMKAPDGRPNQGQARRAVRNMSDREFESIIRAGFAAEIGPAIANSFEASPSIFAPGFAEPQADFERPLVETTITRPFRDAAFARQIQTAYGQRCAMTGLRIINGGGRAEAQAAHIRPVADAGPDSVRNGLALSSTFHWMFDRGLVAIDDDFRILKAKNHLPEQADRMLNPTGYLIVPKDARFQPHSQFLRYHREHKFKG
jgi:putative restriction endonuclease